VLYAGGVNMLQLTEGATDYIRCGAPQFRMNGNQLRFDSDADSYLYASADDVVDFVLATASGELGITINGGEDFTFTANAFTCASGSNIDLNGNSLLIDADGDTYLHDSADGHIQLVIESNAQYTFDATELILSDTGGTDKLWIRTHGDVANTAADILAAADLGLAAKDNAWIFIDSDGSGAGAHFNVASNQEIVTGATPILRLTEEGAMGLMTTSTANMTIGIKIDQSTNDDYIMAFKSATDVAHGMTDYAETATYGAFHKAAATGGGLQIRGLRDSRGSAWKALSLVGFLGEAADTTKTTNGHGVVAVNSAVKSGTGITDVGADGNLFSVENNGTTRFIFDAEGSAHADIEFTTFDEYDDVALLTGLEQSMLAWQGGDPIRSEFESALRENRERLEALGLAHFDDNNPGHAMLNTTKLLMLLTGAVRQLGARMMDAEKMLQAGY